MPGQRAFILFCSVIILIMVPFFLLAQDCSEKYNINFLVIHDGYLPKNFIIKKITYTTDVVVTRNELIALVGFIEGGEVSLDFVQKGLNSLQQKNKFKSTVATLKQMDDGYVIHYEIKGFWSFAKVYCKGTIIGKDRYKHYYLMQHGDRFDETKHEDALQRIRESFYDQGHLNPIVKDSFYRDSETKSISVMLHLRPGQYFSIYRTSVFIETELERDEQEARLVSGKLQKLFFRELRGTVCSKAQVDYALRQAHDYCFRRGFLQVVIVCDKTIDTGHNRVDLLFKVALGEKRSFEFFGNHYFSNKQLLDHLLFFGKSIVFLPPSLLAEELIMLYKQKGFCDIKVSWREEQQRCFFCISEGARMRITRVVIKGAKHFSQTFIDRCFAVLTRNKAFDKQVQRRCRNKMMQAYFSEGFWDCAIVDEAFHIIKNDQYELAITLSEGKQRMLRSVVIKDFEELESEGPFIQYKNLAAAVAFDIHSVQEQRSWLLRYFQRKGYLHVNPQPELIEEFDGMRLVWSIAGTADRVEFGKTIIQGSSHLPASIFMRELAYREGQVWDQDRVDRSLARLRSLGLFEHISLHPLNLEVPQSRKNLLLDYVEDDPFEVRVRAGTQCIGRNVKFRDMSFRVGGSFLWKNPRNLGDNFAFDANVTRYARNIVGCYRLPWIFDCPIKNEFKGYSIRFDQPVAACSVERLYRCSQDGIAAVLGYDSERWQLGAGMGFEWMGVTKLSVKHAQAIDFTPRLIGESVPYLFAEPTLIASYLDDPINPSRGFLSLVTSKLMVPLDKIDGFYIRLLAEQSIFVPLVRSAVLAFRVRVGHMFNRCFQEIMPSDRFYLGGSYSLRAYDADLAPPITGTEFLGRPCLVPIGGRSMINATIELRCPLYQNFGLVCFTDCGALAHDDVKSIHTGNMLGATGFGVRYFTPIGPIRFDIGWKWKKEFEEKRSFAWFLTLGQAF